MKETLLESTSPAMRRVLMFARGVAPTPTTVLLSGESGTGKEVIARAIHQLSDRNNGPFVAINCAAIPGTLMESEFFGHEKGAFSGAGDRKEGKFELAHEGTLLLDEVSEMPLELQAKLLRVIQERQVTRLGGTRTLNVDVRIIATTNRDLKAMVADGSFRRDLYYRINVMPIELPALRDRAVDLAPLSRTLLRRICSRMCRNTAQLTEQALNRLKAHDFPGNIRELQNLLERAVILTQGDVIDVDTLLFDGAQLEVATESETGASFRGQTLAEVERQVILSTLEDLEGNRTRTSEVLGISIRTLRNRLREYRGAGFQVMSYAA